MATFSAETLAAPFTYTGVCAEVTEFWDRATREANPGKNPPVKTDANGVPLLSLDFMRIEEVFGRPQTIVFQVQFPKTAVPGDLEPGRYSLINAVVNVYARDSKIRESWTAEGIEEF